MPRILVAMKLTEDEKALLTKLSERNDMTVADYLRVCMLIDGVMSGDRDAIKLAGGVLREKVAQRFSALLGFGSSNAPVKA